MSWIWKPCVCWRKYCGGSFRLAEARPFYRLDPGKLDVAPEEAADMQATARTAPTVDMTGMRPVDLVICGSVAVNKTGARIGKGAGYSDIELALLAEAGLLSEKTTIATTVHELQMIDDELPEETTRLPRRPDRRARASDLVQASQTSCRAGLEQHHKTR